MELITTDELVDEVADKVLERLALLPEKTGEQDSRSKPWVNCGMGSVSEFSFNSFDGGQIIPPMETSEYIVFPVEVDEGTSAEKTSTWCDMVLAAYKSGGSGYPSGESAQNSLFDDDGMLHAPKATPDEQEAAASETDDFADVMRNGLGAIVAWFNEDAGNTEPEEVERYSLRLELVIFGNGCGEAAVYNEGKYLGDVDLTPDNIAALFSRG